MAVLVARFMPFQAQRLQQIHLSLSSLVELLRLLLSGRYQVRLALLVALVVVGLEVPLLLAVLAVQARPTTTKLEVIKTILAVEAVVRSTIPRHSSVPQ
jgi:hypothetical protein